MSLDHPLNIRFPSIYTTPDPTRGAPTDIIKGTKRTWFRLQGTVPILAINVPQESRPVLPILELVECETRLEGEFDSLQPPVSPSNILGTKTPRLLSRGVNSRHGGDGGESVFTINDNLGHSGYLVEPSAD